MSKKRFIIFFTVIPFLFGCEDKSGFQKPTTQIQQSAQTPDVKRALSYIKTVPGDEYEGFVYEGMLHKELRDNGFGWSLLDVSKAFGIPVQEIEKPEQYKDFVIPYEFRIGSKDNEVTFRLDTSHKESLKYLKFAEGANATYHVFQNDHEVKMETQPFTHHGGGINIQPLELLQLLHIGYIQKGQTIYVGQDKPSPINGKVLFDNKVEIGSNQKLNVSLVYYYDPGTKPNYEKVELIIDGEPVILFDQDHKGSSGYYQNGFVEAITFRGSQLLKVNLDEDAIILKRTSNRWERVFSPEKYNSILHGTLSLQIASDGSGKFIDSEHRLTHEVSTTGGMPNTVYPIDLISFGHFELDEAQKELAITAELSARNEGRSIFNMKVRFLFDGTTFIPNRMASWDDGKFGADKSSGKEIQSLDDYMQFSYSL
ncbi:hypothetical protein SD70_19395 [Gordoniibacillus kamchatkensis]|uniref:Lipoprotein n=1 Tax=Gordoniibacillus kamchatkensis TaxID=1590651 RepID=A0ABR5AEU2_9BACL|nr:hypothetical protein [Paenibacillus sp. VKM B-2647]KIL39569.1 hypothetical protein SD70_19395 [Paenibacillus sp. VKM B-2647]